MDNSRILDERLKGGMSKETMKEMSEVLEWLKNQENYFDREFFDREKRRIMNARRENNG